MRASMIAGAVSLAVIAAGGGCGRKPLHGSDGGAGKNAGSIGGAAQTGGSGLGPTGSGGSDGTAGATGSAGATNTGGAGGIAGESGTAGTTGIGGDTSAGGSAAGSGGNAGTPAGTGGGAAGSGGNAGTPAGTGGGAGSPNPRTLSFQAASYGRFNRAYAVAVGDLNGDGSLDIAVANERPQQTTAIENVLLNDGRGQFQVTDGFSAKLRSIALADLNGDGRLDIIGSGPVVLFNNGDATFR